MDKDHPEGGGVNTATYFMLLNLMCTSAMGHMSECHFS